MRHCTVYAIFILLLWTGTATGEDLIKNPGFEHAADSGAAADWNGTASVYNRDTAVHRSGDASLKGVNTDKAVYVLCSQPVALARDKMYEISAWVKTQDIAGEEDGATICAEWYSADGKWLGGCYPQGVKGAADWTLVKGVTARIPPEAAGCSLSCYFRQGMTGTAWWDDISIVPYAERPLASVLVSPNYRSQALGPNPDPIRIRCFVRLVDYPFQLGDVLLAWRAVNTANQAVSAQGEMAALTDTTTDVVIDGQSLSAGHYSVEVALKPKNGGAVLATDTVAFSRSLETP